MVLNNVTNFQFILIITIRLGEGTSLGVKYEQTDVRVSTYVCTEDRDNI